MYKKHILNMIMIFLFIQWTGISPLSAQEEPLFGVHTFEADSALVFGVGGTVWTTNNGGQTWEARYSGPEILRGVTFFRNTGWIVGDNTILKSVDRGKTWMRLSSPADMSFFSVSFVDSLTGWLTTGLDTVYKTINGGENWTATSIDPSNTAFYETVFFVDADTGWAVGDLIGDSIAKSTDGGESWAIQNCDTPSGVCPGGIYDVFALDGTHAWAVGLDSTIYHTTNGGDPWTIEVRETRFSPTSSVLNSVHFVNAQTGWIAGGIPGVILKTTDGGGTWESQFEDPDRSIDLWSVHSPSPDVAWAVGDFRDENGVNLAFILRTTDGGQTWENLSDNIVSVERDEETVPQQFRLFQNYPNPFNSGTTIRYQIEKRGRATLKIYNVLGEEIRTLVNEVQAPGGHSLRWDGKDRKGVEVASGIYVSRLQVGERVETRKMLLVR